MLARLVDKEDGGSFIFFSFSDCSTRDVADKYNLLHSRKDIQMWLHGEQEVSYPSNHRERSVKQVCKYGDSHFQRAGGRARVGKRNHGHIRMTHKCHNVLRVPCRPEGSRIGKSCQLSLKKLCTSCELTSNASTRTLLAVAKDHRKGCRRETASQQLRQLEVL